MRRVMRELDRIYFQPLFQKKFRCFMRYKRTKQKRTDKKSAKKKSTVSVETANNSETRRIQGGGAAAGDGIMRKECIFEEIFQDAHDGTSRESLAVRSPGCNLNTNESDERAFHSAEGGTDESKQDCRKVWSKPLNIKKRAKGKSATKESQTQCVMVSRKLRTWLAERKIFIYRSKQKVKRNKWGFSKFLYVR